jgi:hypothetical protein
MISRSHVRGGNAVHASRDRNLKGLDTSEVREDLTGFPVLLLAARVREIGMTAASRDFLKEQTI